MRLHCTARSVRSSKAKRRRLSLLSDIVERLSHKLRSAPESRAYSRGIPRVKLLPTRPGVIPVFFLFICIFFSPPESCNNNCSLRGNRHTLYRRTNTAREYERDISENPSAGWNALVTTTTTTTVVRGCDENKCRRGISNLLYTRLLLLNAYYIYIYTS